MTLPLRPCAMPGCPALGARTYCALHARQQEQQRPRLDSRRWYYTARWKALRARILVEAHYTCAQCARVTVDLVVDHVVPHRGNPTLFWSRTNLQALCPSCHSRKTQAGG